MSASDRREFRATKGASVAPPAPAGIAPDPTVPALKVVPPETSEQAAQRQWETLELQARAEREGVKVESLKPREAPRENWRDKLAKQAPPPSPAYAGLYHLTGGHFFMTADEVAPPDSFIELNAADGKHVTDRGIGVRVGSAAPKT